jgi:hypothetical protein
MHFLIVIYIVSLSTILATGVASPYLRWSRASVAIFLLLWTDLILTAQILSLFSALNNTGAYIVISIAVAAGLALGCRQIPLEREAVFTKLDTQLPPAATTRILWFLAISGGLVLLGELILAYGALPANPDSISYRFPRVYWYFSQGSLMHFSEQADPRAIYYPFNGTLAYFPFVHFRLGPRAFTIPSLLSWLAVTFTTYVFSRDLGGSRVAAAATAWLIALTPIVLIQSTSTNDDIICAAALLAGLFFLHRWFRGRQLFDAALGMIGAGISAGTKLHIMFYWPLLVLIALTLMIRYRAVVDEAKSRLNVRAAAAFATILLTTSIFSFSFIAYNLASAGRATAWEFDDQLLNKPFNLFAGLQNIVLYAAQMVLTPVADLHSNFNYPRSARYYEAFNHFFAPLFGWVNNGSAFTSVFYRFNGINSSSAFFFNELTVFIGFTWLVAAMAGAWLIHRWKDPRFTWARWHLASLPAWFVTYAMMSRYIEGFSVYLSYATIVAAPAFVFAFAPIVRPRLDQVRWALLGFVAVTHCFFAVTVLFTSLPRNLSRLHAASSWPLSPGFAIDQSVEDEIGRAKAGIYDHLIAWEQPHWIYMAYHPEIPQFLARTPDPLPVPANAPTDPASIALRYSRYALMPPAGTTGLHVYSFPQIPVYGHAIPIRIPDKASPGLTLIGNILFALGPEWIFAAGNHVESRHSGQDRYVVLPFTEENDFGHSRHQTFRFTSVIYGLGPNDHLEFRYQMRIAGKITTNTGWQPTPDVQLNTDGLTTDNGLLTVYVRNDDASGSVYSTQVNLLSTKPQTLTTETR